MDNKIAILESKIEVMEREKGELIECVSTALSKSTKDGWLYRVFETVIKKYNIKTGE